MLARWVLRALLITPLGVALGFVAGRLLRIRRCELVARVEAAGVEDGCTTADAMYRSLGVGLVELVLCSLGVPLSSCARFEAGALLALRSRFPTGGVVVACAHTANWDLVACHVASSWPLLVISKELRIRWLNRVWMRMRRRRGITVVSPGGAAARALDHLRRGGAVVSMIDQAPVSHRGATPGVFFGRPVGLDLSPSLLAMRARVPLVVAFPRRLEDGAYTVELSKVLHPPRRPRASWPAEALQEATDCLERFVCEHPGQWLWLHRRWKAWPFKGRLVGASNSSDDER